MYMQSLASYGAETETMTKEDIKILGTFEMLVCRIMERVTLMEFKTNEDMLQMVTESYH